MLQDVIKSLTSNLRSLREFIDLVDSFLKEKEEEIYKSRDRDLVPLKAGMKKAAAQNPDSDLEFSDKDLLKMQEEFGGEFDIEIQDDEEGMSRIGFKIIGEHQERFDDALDELRKSSHRSRLLYYSALMNLTSIVEWYFSQLLHLYFDKYPNAIGIKDKVFSYEDLKTFDSIKDAKNHYKNSRIETILRDSFKDWINFFKQSSINLSMGYIKDDEEVLYETFLRRNIVVHNAGRVNSTYLHNVSSKYSIDLEVDETLPVTRDYLDERIDLFERNCVLIALELWKNLDQKDEERASFLDELNYDYIKEGRFNISKFTTYFLINDKAMPEEFILSGKLNYWLSLKRLGNWDQIKDEVKETNFNAKDKLFQLGYFSLTEEHDKFFTIFPKALRSEDIVVEAAREFPILEEVREDKRFEEIIKEYESNLN